jgi:PIN domain nuclease of toxin-antitoxin system
VIECVLDASVVLAYLGEEPGHEKIATVLDQAAVSAVNIAEVATKLAEKGAPEQRIRETIRDLSVEIVAFDEGLSYRVADLRHGTRALGLPLGDRACLATARHFGVPAITADRRWSRLKVGVEIQLLR